MKRFLSATIAIFMLFCLYGCETADISNIDGNIRTETDTKNSNTTDSTNVGGMLEKAQAIAVSYIDVGQGDSELILLPDSRTILIDAGEAKSADAVIEHIKFLGIKRLDYVIATHPHADHIGGMAKVINTFDIGEIYMPKVSTDTKTFENLLQTIKDNGLSINTAKSGVTMLDEGKIKAKFIAPVKDSYDDLNNYSAVLKLSYDNVSFLFMGDAETQSENQISADVNADVIKIGHHGSNTSSAKSFLKKVSPKYAVISCGKDNSYNHPHKETLEKLDELNIKYYRTDINGTVVIMTDGKNIEVKAEME